MRGRVELLWSRRWRSRPRLRGCGAEGWARGLGRGGRGSGVGRGLRLRWRSRGEGRRHFGVGWRLGWGRRKLWARGRIVGKRRRRGCWWRGHGRGWWGVSEVVHVWDANSLSIALEATGSGNRRRRKHLRDDLLPNIQAYDSLASLHNFTSQIATKDGGIVRSKDVLVLHDPIDGIDSYAMDSDCHMARRRSAIWGRRNDEWSTFGS